MKGSNEQNDPQVVRRIDNVYTCSNEVFSGGLCQIRSQVVGHIITDKFINKQLIYTPNDIRTYMQQVDNVQLTNQQAYQAEEAYLEIV